MLTARGLYQNSAPGSPCPTPIPAAGEGSLSILAAPPQPECEGWVGGEEGAGEVGEAYAWVSAFSLLKTPGAGVSWEEEEAGTGDWGRSAHLLGDSVTQEVGEVLLRACTLGSGWPGCEPGFVVHVTLGKQPSFSSPSARVEGGREGLL